MTRSPISILSAEPVVVIVDSTRIEIRELNFLQLLAFTEKLAGVASQFFSMSEGGAIRVSIDDLAGVVRGSSELSHELLTATTKLTAEQLDQLPASAVLVLLEQAIALNLSEEFLARGKALAARVKAVVRGPEQATLEASSST